MRLLLMLPVLVLLAACQSSDSSTVDTAEDLMNLCVSPLDGHHDELEEMIRSRLDDSASMVSQHTYYLPDDSLDDKEIELRMSYTLTQADEDLELNAYARMGLDCRILEILSYGF